jgi:hypothetical protein
MAILLLDLKIVYIMVKSMLSEMVFKMDDFASTCSAAVFKD